MCSIPFLKSPSQHCHATDVNYGRGCRAYVFANLRILAADLRLHYSHHFPVYNPPPKTPAADTPHSGFYPSRPAPSPAKPYPAVSVHPRYPAPAPTSPPHPKVTQMPSPYKLPGPPGDDSRVNKRFFAVSCLCVDFHCLKFSDISEGVLSDQFPTRPVGFQHPSVFLP